MIDIGIQHTQQSMFLIPLQSLDDKLLIMREEKEAAAFALRLCGLKDVISILDDGE